MSWARQDDAAISYDALSARLREAEHDRMTLQALLENEQRWRKDIEAERDRLQKRLDDRIRSRPKVSRRDLDAANKRLRAECDRLREIARLILLAYNHPSGEYGEFEADHAADLAADYFDGSET